jgi:hypothetical protein
MEVDSSLVQANLYTRNEGTGAPTSESYQPFPHPRPVPSRWPSVYCKLQNSEKIVCKSILPCLAITVAVLALWSLVVLITAFYAWPLSPQEVRLKSCAFLYSYALRSLSTVQEMGNNSNALPLALPGVRWKSCALLYS